MIRFLFIIILIGLAGCESQEKVNDKKLVRAYVGLKILEESKQPSYKHYTGNRDSILSEYGYNKDSYEKAYTEMSLDEERWQAFYDSALAYLDSLKKSGK